jgi:LmbE family N-acetylglucosaminyl deacetylase
MNLFIQPHPDDVPWSCGGTVARLVEEGERCLVATVFSGAPDPALPLTALARGLHARWQTGDDPMPVRSRENTTALAVLGADSAELGYREALYRGDAYDTVAKLLSAPVETDRPLMCELGERLLSLCRHLEPARVFSPLGIGNHVDHLLCFEAAEALRPTGAAVYYYEDFPYVIRDRAGLAARLAQIGAVLVPTVLEVTDQLDRRIQATLSYRSQLATLFRGDDPAEAVRGYAREIAGGVGFAERFWRSDAAGALA